jgi:hypothetical protein
MELPLKKERKIVMKKYLKFLISVLLITIVIGSLTIHAFVDVTAMLPKPMYSIAQGLELEKIAQIYKPGSG